jgi:glycosyltransferase involved in cell wall biosynthesis
MSILFIQYGSFGTFNHVLQYSLVDNNLQVITRCEPNNNKNKIFNGYKNAISLKCNNKTEFALQINELLKSKIYDVNKIVVVYFAGCSLIKVFNPSIKIALDIRTFSINKSKIKRVLFNNLINFEALFFDKAFILSDGMKKQLWRVNRGKSCIVPLGAERPSFYDNSLSNNSKEKIFIYVGTFNDRSIDDLIRAFDKFCKIRIDYKLQIIGRGNNSEIDKIFKAIAKCKYSSNVEYIGEVRFPELAKYLNKASIGLSYIPINDKYDNQPPTKTYEYLMANCFVIASGTLENKKIINKSNGIIIDNSESSLINAMTKACDIDIGLIDNLDIIDEFSWSNIYHKIKELLM